MPKSLKSKPIPAVIAKRVGKKLLQLLKPHVIKAEILGSLFRGHATVGDLDVLVIPNTPGSFALPANWIYEGVPVNIFFTTEKSWGASRLHWRLGRAVVQLKGYAKRKGFKLNRYGLWDAQNNFVAGTTEESIYETLGLEYPGAVHTGPGHGKIRPKPKRANYPKPIVLSASWTLTTDELTAELSTASKNVDGFGDIMERYPEKQLLCFWSETHKPHDFIDSTVPVEKRKRIAAILQAGKVVNSYRGWASCRICRERLGSQDLSNGKFVWPSKAEHYVLQHAVWLPEFDQL